MIKRVRFPKIFFGWWTVLAGGILAMWAAGYNTYGLSALFKPIASELGFSRVATSVPAAIGRLEGGFEGPVAGWVTDRFGPREIVLFGVFLVGLGLILMYFINSLWAFFIIWGVILGTGHNIGTTIPIDTSITNWFVRKRGLALSIKGVFQGLSGVLVLPLIAWLIITQGWRMTVLIGGVVMLVIGLPLAWFCLKQHRPEYYGLLPDGATTEEETTEASQMIDRGVKYATEVKEVEFTLRQAMRTPAFWMMTAAQAVLGLTGPPITTHSIPFLTDIGIEPLRAAGILAMMALATILSRLAIGLIADRLRINHLRFLLGGTFLLEAVGIAVFLLNQSITMIYVWFILRGIAMGGGFLFSAMTARYFGRKAFGSIQGTKTMLLTPVAIAALIYVGWVYDTTGSYMTAFGAVAAALIASTVLMSFATPPKPPAQVTDVRKIV